jgi:hypothetical protein
MAIPIPHLSHLSPITSSLHFITLMGKSIICMAMEHHHFLQVNHHKSSIDGQFSITNC